MPLIHIRAKTLDEPKVKITASPLRPLSPFVKMLDMRPQRNFLHSLIFLSILCIGLGVSKPAQASPEREFIMSCTYGVLAGSLVGAASLAFVDRPSDNLQRIARGASLGLYLGIGLGYYSVYVLPKKIEREEDRLLQGKNLHKKKNNSPKYFVFPLFDESKLEGVAGVVQIAAF